MRNEWGDPISSDIELKFSRGGRSVTIAAEVQSDGVNAVVDTFRQFLAAIGYTEKTINSVLNRD